MFRWYRKAKVCYAYLSDVSDIHDLSHSRWFTRGWTLQELIAPAQVQFFGQDWRPLGSKLDLCSQLADSSGIEEQVLRSGQFVHVSIARKMSWAARRQTTRIEDEAYCLLGIFGVNSMNTMATVCILLVNVSVRWGSIQKLSQQQWPARQASFASSKSPLHTDISLTMSPGL
jgi:hypothetical protein